MIAAMIVFILIGIGLVVTVFFLPAKKAPAAAKDSAVKEIAKETISKLEAEVNSLRMELEKEQLKISALKGEVSAAKEAEEAMRQELEQLKGAALKKEPPPAPKKEKQPPLKKETESPKE